MKHSAKILLPLLAVLCFSCTKPQEEETPEVKIGLRLETENASYQKDGRFVYVEANGPWTLALEAVGEGDTSWASLTATSGTGNKNVVMSYDYNGSDDARSLSVVLTGSDGSTVTKGFVQAGITSGPVAPEKVPGWLELPQETSNLRYYNHSFSYEGSRYRNYSFGWDAPNRLSLWVAYPLCGFYTKKNVDRSKDAWGFDPNVPVSEQANLTSSYRGNYDRGHQIPSADRLVSSQANAQTFYFTNMTPQRDVFNQGVWGNIESKVRGWISNSDTLYVVTGCVMDGKSGSTTDAAGNKCPLPAAYYKAVLRYSKSSTVGISGYSGIGIYLDHNGNYSSKQSLSSDMVMSLSALESKLGYKLFVNLDTVLSPETATRIKNQNPENVNFWEIGK